MELRQAFVKSLTELMEKDENICIIDADLARASATLSLRQKFPERALDVGVAEANMASVAAGLSSYGFIPFITTFAPFATRRICDQVAISIAYAKRSVKIVGTDPGISAELNGGTHMAFEDVGIMRTIPSMVVFEPVDEIQLSAAMEQITYYDGPVYIRLFRKQTPVVFKEDYVFDLFKADLLKEGTDVTILATGIMVERSLKAAEELLEKGINAEVINVHTIKPLDKETILKSVKKTGAVVTAENHNVIGGLFSAVCELLAAENPMKIFPVAVMDKFGQVGKLDELSNEFKLNVSDIVLNAEVAFNSKKQ